MCITNRSNPGTPTQIRRPDFIYVANQQQPGLTYYDFPMHQQQQNQMMMMSQQQSQTGLPLYSNGSPQRRFLSEGELLSRTTSNGLSIGNELSYVNRTNNTVDNIRELAGSPQRGVYNWKDNSPPGQQQQQQQQQAVVNQLQMNMNNMNVSNEHLLLINILNTMYNDNNRQIQNLTDQNNQIINIENSIYKLLSIKQLTDEQNTKLEYLENKRDELMELERIQLSAKTHLNFDESNRLDYLEKVECDKSFFSRKVKLKNSF